MTLAVLAVDVSGARSAAVQGEEHLSRRERLDALVASVGTYVDRFQSEMEAAVLDESYVQILRRPCCREPRDPGSEPLLRWDAGNVSPRKGTILARRQLRSEVLLVRIAGGDRVGYRDVYEVDGKTVQGRTERVRQLFLSGTEESALELGRIAAESARFNLGPMRRTTNLPTTPLLYLAPSMAGRLYFSRGGEDEVEGAKTTVLEFREDGSPTLAAAASGVDMPARGRAWVEPDTGRVRKIELRYDSGARRVMVVWFRPEPRVGILVPDRMWEWYEKIPVGEESASGAVQRSWPADVEALATYTNLRLFSVSTSEEVGDSAN